MIKVCSGGKGGEERGGEEGDQGVRKGRKGGDHDIL